MSKIDEVYAVVEEVGYDKAPRELCKRGLCTSMAQARREVKYIKIAKGDKQVKEFDKK